MPATRTTRVTETRASVRPRPRPRFRFHSSLSAQWIANVLRPQRPPARSHPALPIPHPHSSLVLKMPALPLSEHPGHYRPQGGHPFNAQLPACPAEGAPSTTSLRSPFPAQLGTKPGNAALSIPSPCAARPIIPADGALTPSVRWDLTPSALMGYTFYLPFWPPGKEDRPARWMLLEGRASTGSACHRLNVATCTITPG